MSWQRAMNSRAIALWAFALAVPLLAGAAVFAVMGADPLAAYSVMFQGAFGSWGRFSEVLVKASALSLTGLAVILAARMNLWNIGCEGQLVMGAVFATAAALNLGDTLPPALMLPCAALCGMAGGAVWASGPAWLRSRLGVSEIITTLLLNYVAIALMEHLYFGVWRDPAGFGFPGTAMFAEAARLPRLTGTRVHPGLLAGIAGAVLLAWALAKTRWGYELTVMGLGPKAASYAGMNAARRGFWVLLFSGAIAGLAGMAEVTGIHYRLQQGVAVGYGYDGVIVACLARLHPALATPAAVVLAAVLVGGEYLQTKMRLPSAASLVIEAALLLSLLWLQVRKKR
ncbi:ABC transporter permease [Fundidesulfovibrio soli]|uniref:ABC transporter permease n=1 Tax=Fundidesulfovibrio soli TaxID=2922716 RepID=UPI001FAEC200|nr:ABC transporter permease [Fundidesulfovibrio soli]